MSRFRNTLTGVVISVDDSKDDRYTSGAWESADSEPSTRRHRAKATADTDSK